MLIIVANDSIVTQRGTGCESAAGGLTCDDGTVDERFENIV